MSGGCVGDLVVPPVQEVSGVVALREVSVLTVGGHGGGGRGGRG